jgi:hypothetical protein
MGTIPKCSQHRIRGLRATDSTLWVDNTDGDGAGWGQPRLMAEEAFDGNLS